MSYVDLDVVLETAAKENKNILSFKLFQVQCQEFCVVREQCSMKSKKGTLLWCRYNF